MNTAQILSLDSTSKIHSCLIVASVVFFVYFFVNLAELKFVVLLSTCAHLNLSDLLKVFFFSFLFQLLWSSFSCFLMQHWRKKMSMGTKLIL